MIKKKHRHFSGVPFHELLKDRASSSTFSAAGDDENMEENIAVVLDDDEQNQNVPSNMEHNVMDVAARKLEGKEIVIHPPGTSVDCENQVIDGYKVIDSKTLLSMVNTCSKFDTCGTLNKFMIEQYQKQTKRPLLGIKY